MDRRFLIGGSIVGLLAVAIGAFATHGLQPNLSATAIKSFETGVKYQMYHALLMLILGGIPLLKLKFKSVIFYLLLIGVILFSGSIYGLSTNELTAFDFTHIALLTPLGGLILIVVWVLLIVNSIKLKNK